jgi:hypothetical protein
MMDIKKRERAAHVRTVADGSEKRGFVRFGW